MFEGRHGRLLEGDRRYSDDFPNTSSGEQQVNRQDRHVDPSRYVILEPTERTKVIFMEPEQPKTPEGLVSGHVTILTGAGPSINKDGQAIEGIGAALARKIAMEGGIVVINSRSEKPETLPAVIAFLDDLTEEKGQPAMWVKADVGNPEDAAVISGQTLARFGRVDELFNGAGVNNDELGHRMRDEQWDNVINTKLRGTFLMTRNFLEYKVRTKDRYGRVLNVASISGIVPVPSQGNYGAANMGIIGYTMTVASEGYFSPPKRDIAINVVAPGLVYTRMIHDNMPARMRTYVESMIPGGKGMQPEDIAGQLFPYLTPHSQANGELIIIDQGLTRKMKGSLLEQLHRPNSGGAASTPSQT